jgi:hypothetical protein
MISPGSANAATSCRGSLIESKPLKKGSTKYGSLDVYYDASKRKNCAKTVNATHVGRYVSVLILRCKAGTGTTADNCNERDEPNDTNYDEGWNYSQYAGPVWTDGVSSGLCILAIGAIQVKDRDYIFAEIGGHCG